MDQTPFKAFDLDVSPEVSPLLHRVATAWWAMAQALTPERRNEIHQGRAVEIPYFELGDGLGLRCDVNPGGLGRNPRERANHLYEIRYRTLDPAKRVWPVMTIQATGVPFINEDGETMLFSSLMEMSWQKNGRIGMPRTIVFENLNIHIRDGVPDRGALYYAQALVQTGDHNKKVASTIPHSDYERCMLLMGFPFKTLNWNGEPEINPLHPKFWVNAEAEFIFLTDHCW